ncbi:hypothetical protein GCM10027268_03930 [Brachybacterium huguangmaarense]
MEARRGLGSGVRRAAQAQMMQIRAGNTAVPVMNDPLSVFMLTHDSTIGQHGRPEGDCSVPSPAPASATCPP